MTTLAVIADDDPAARFFYQHVLNSMGFDVLEAADGLQTLTLLEMHSPDLLVLDMRMPRLSGGDILQYVHEAHHLQHTRVVIISAHQTRIELLRPHDLFLLKPVTAHQLAEVVGHIFSGSDVQPE